MKKKQISLSINTFDQAREVVESLKIHKIIAVLHIKNYLIKGFGIDWLLSIVQLLKKKYSPNSFKFFVDAGYDHSLSILLAKNKIDYIKLKSTPKIKKKN